MGTGSSRKLQCSVHLILCGLRHMIVVSWLKAQGGAVSRSGQAEPMLTPRSGGRGHGPAFQIELPEDNILLTMLDLPTLVACRSVVGESGHPQLRLLRRLSAEELTLVGSMFVVPWHG